MCGAMCGGVVRRYVRLREFQTPNRVVGPCGGKRIHETTLPLLNMVILLSFAHLTDTDRHARTYKGRSPVVR